MAYGILVPQQGLTEPGPIAVRTQSPNHGTPREFLLCFRYSRNSAFIPTQRASSMPHTDCRLPVVDLDPSTLKPRVPPALQDRVAEGMTTC